MSINTTTSFSQKISEVSDDYLHQIRVDGTEDDVSKKESCINEPQTANDSQEMRAQRPALSVLRCRPPRNTILPSTRRSPPSPPLPVDEGNDENHFGTVATSPNLNHSSCTSRKENRIKLANSTLGLESPFLSTYFSRRSDLKIPFRKDLMRASDIKGIQYCSIELNQTVQDYAKNPSIEKRIELAQNVRDQFGPFSTAQKEVILNNLLVSQQLDRFNQIAPILYTILFSDLIDITWQERPLAARIADLAHLCSVAKRRKMMGDYHYDVDWKSLAHKALEEVKPEDRILYLSLIREDFPNPFNFLFGEIFEKEVNRSSASFAQALVSKMIDPSSLKYEEKIEEVVAIQKEVAKEGKAAKKWLAHMQELYIDQPSEKLSELIKLFIADCQDEKNFDQIASIINFDSIRILLLENETPFLEICEQIYAYLKLLEGESVQKLDNLKFFVDFCKELQHPLWTHIQDDFCPSFEEWFYEELNLIDSNKENGEYARLLEIKMHRIYKNSYDSFKPEEKRAHIYINKLMEEIVQDKHRNIPQYYHGTTSFGNVCSMLNENKIRFEFARMRDGNSGAWVSTKREEDMPSPRGTRKYPYCLVLANSIRKKAQNQPHIIPFENKSERIWVGFQDQKTGIGLGLKEGASSHVCHISVPQNMVKSIKHKLKWKQFQKDGQHPIDVWPHSVSDCFNGWLTSREDQLQYQQRALKNWFDFEKRTIL